MRVAFFLGALSITLGCRPVLADEPASDSAEVVVTGSRAAPRAATETSAPVDILSQKALGDKGYSSLSETLEALEPSVNYPRSSTSFSSNGTRSFTLRGLTPDETLVLVNGHRWHSSSVLVSNSTSGRGTVPVDLNTLPISAIDHIEILRDGASAQYGSDAIAGVVNVVLREDASGGSISSQYGINEKGDGQTLITNVSKGLVLGNGGYLTLTGEFRKADSSNSAGIDPRVGRITQHMGDPDQSDADLVANWSVPVQGSFEIYGDTSLARRITDSTPLFRLATVAPTLYPLGFLPAIRMRLTDIGNTVGAHGNLGDWTWDLSDTFGYNRANFGVTNTVNTSLLQAPVQTAFDSGGSRYTQNIADLTVADKFPDFLSGANLALGLEQRYERYQLISGEPNSYFGAGAQGLPGYHPPSPVDADRTAIGAFIDFETDLTKQLRLGLASRYENYSDFGGKATGKLSLFYRPAELVALRSTVSTGFRAPSLAQEYFSSVTSSLDTTTHNLVNIGTFAVDDPVARALGSSALRPETSVNYSAGLVLTPLDQLTFAVDGYHIRIHDRISLSDSLSGATVTAILHANGITNAGAAQFFTNAADTVTKGWEATSNWRSQLGLAKVELTLGYGRFDNDLERLRGNQALPTLPILGKISLGLLLNAQPRDKLSFSTSTEIGPWRLSADATRYGTIVTPDTGQVFGADVVIDASASVKIGGPMRVLAGITNLTNRYPDKVIPNPDGRQYSELTAIGVDGRAYYLRVTAQF